MEKKKSPNLDISQATKSSEIFERFPGILKFILGILLLPFVYSFTRAFIDEFLLLGRLIQINFLAGIVCFLIIYLFIWEPKIFYKSGQRFLEVIFHFFAGLVKVAPFVLPIYTIILFLLYFLTPFIGKSQELNNYFVLLIGFSTIFHLVFSAESLKSSQAGYLKANYIFGICLIYIINIILLSFGFNLIFKEFSFVTFFNHSFEIAASIFQTIFSQLFL